jgi:hypothetical protein
MTVDLEKIKLEDGDRSCARKVIHTMGRVQKVNEFRCQTPSKKSHRIVLLLHATLLKPQN